jgi:hypothetical protein
MLKQSEKNGIGRSENTRMEMEEIDRKERDGRPRRLLLGVGLRINLESQREYH